MMPLSGDIHQYFIGEIMAKVCGIYRITSPTMAIYIGQSVDISDRKSAYKNLRCKQQFKLYNSIKKYGWDNHKFHIIHECSPYELNKLEVFYIDLYNSFDTLLGLNLDTGGKSNFTRSQSTKNKIKEKRKLQIISEETRAKMSLFQRTRVRSNLSSQNISKALTGKKLSPEHAIKAGNAMRGKKHSNETKIKMSLAHTGRKVSPEVRHRISEVKKSKKLISDKHPRSKKVNQFTLDGILIKTWNCSVDPQREAGFNSSHISSCCRGERKSAHGFKWSYT